MSKNHRQCLTTRKILTKMSETEKIPSKIYEKRENTEKKESRNRKNID